MTEPIGPRSVPAGPVVLGGARTAVIVPIVATDDDELDHANAALGINLSRDERPDADSDVG